MASRASIFSVSSHATVLLQTCKSLASQLKAGRAVHAPLNLRNCFPSKKICPRLKQAYLQAFESMFRVLHVPSFERDYKQYWENRQVASDSSVVRLLLVVAVGSCFYRDSTSSGPSLHESSALWILAANRHLSDPVEKRHLNLGGVQNQCLLLLALQTNVVGGEHRWTYRLVESPKNFIVIGGSFTSLRLATRLDHTSPTGNRVILIEKNSHFNFSFNFRGSRCFVGVKHEPLSLTTTLVPSVLRVSPKSLEAWCRVSKETLCSLTRQLPRHCQRFVPAITRKSRIHQQSRGMQGAAKRERSHQGSPNYRCWRRSRWCRNSNGHQVILSTEASSRRSFSLPASATFWSASS